MEVRRSAFCAALIIIAQCAFFRADAYSEVNACDIFVLVDDTIDVGGPNSTDGIAFDGIEWHIADLSTNSWRNFDTEFNLLDSTMVAGAEGPVYQGFRGLAFDQSSGNIFVVGSFRQVVYEVTLAGSVVNSFSSNVPEATNAIAIDPDGSLWLVAYRGLITHVTRTGALLDSFTTPDLFWTGAAFDRTRDTLLLFEGNDSVHEYGTDGTPLGVPIAHDAVAGNGQGLAYDSKTSVLHVTSQEGRIAIWRRGAGAADCLEIDIEPGSDPAVIKLFGSGLIPVAILGSEIVDVFDVDETTLEFGPLGAHPSHTRRNTKHRRMRPSTAPGPKAKRAHGKSEEREQEKRAKQNRKRKSRQKDKPNDRFQDVNDDGIVDLVSHFHTQETGIAFGDTESCVTGELVDGTPFSECDDIVGIPQCDFGFGRLTSGTTEIAKVIDYSSSGRHYFLGPAGLGVDSSNNIYVAGASSDQVLQISPSGTITRIIDYFGSGLGTNLITPRGIAVDSRDNVYVTGADSDNAFRISPGGTITQIINFAGARNGTRLYRPDAIAVDSSDNVYVAGRWSHNAFRITPAGTMTQIIDSTGDGLGNELKGPRSIVADSSGNVYVMGRDSYNVFRITPAGTITQIIDSTAGGAGELLAPFSIAIDSSDNVYVAGWLSDNAFKISPAGVVTQIIDATGDGGANTLRSASFIAIDSSDSVYVSGFSTDNAFQITPAGTVTQIIDATGDGDDELASPSGIAIDSSGNVYVVGTASGNVFRISPVCLPEHHHPRDRAKGTDDTRTVPGCGIGFELAFLLAPMSWLYARRDRLTK